MAVDGQPEEDTSQSKSIELLQGGSNEGFENSKTFTLTNSLNLLMKRTRGELR